ncbi:TVG0374267 [Thermoplasma volcanium GSS1]|uniref:TVG0374267 protein n=1 Tax=Thermoplasma volcanium (strain ATCC 51530 / DSM 4299 / JCM 9571 / NBRC 15438 / GSS1) TaxID=273116 RepID=Q97BR8_THEVO|nr:Snf7 family protein [Thermoplasma volcanium]BAB59529.1 TVG0374267 [Thermoplasma volcanium GSS1]
MVFFKFGKSEEEKMLERRSRISKWKSDIDRAIRQYEKNREMNIQNAKISLRDGNLEKARVFASNIVSLESAIRGLKDYKLFLENIDLNLQFADTTKKVWASLKEGSEDLLKSQLTEKQVIQMQQNVEKIINSSDQIQERLSSQLDQITTAVNQRGEYNVESVDKILETLKGDTEASKSASRTSEPAQGEATTDKELEDLLKSLGGVKSDDNK